MIAHKQRLVVYALRGAGQKRLMHLSDELDLTLCGRVLPPGGPHDRVRWVGTEDLRAWSDGPRCPRCESKAERKETR